MKDEKERKLIDLKTRTKAFALRVVHLYSALPQTTVGQVIGKQLLRSGTSVGAHLPRRHSQPVGCRVHQQNRGRITGVRGNVLLAGVAWRKRNAET